MKYFYIVVFLFLGHSIFSQQLSGNVISYAGDIIIDAYIYKLSSDSHTHTDLRGNFAIEDIQEGDTIVVSYLGHETIHRVITKADFLSKIEIVMEEGDILLNQIKVSSNARSSYQISKVDLKLNPVTSSQEILQKVPGLIISQHAGGGKAEQIFLRGFDIDHGTDIAISVDGMPVNLVSHAHGQGYADLHFLIPEVIKDIEFGKGAYYSDVGNFGTAGYVNFSTKEKIDKSQIGVEYGMFNTSRLHGIIDLLDAKENTDAYLAMEYLLSDGPFDSPQNFNRINIMGKITHTMDDDSKLSISASRFTSMWDASGQIPQRLVDSGTITRFGAVDDTEGGKTSRSNITVNHQKPLTNHSMLTTNAYYSNYDFLLFSNFTFFLDNPEGGDQIMQKEQRSLFGFESSYMHSFNHDPFMINHRVGIGMRHDIISDNELSSTLNRQITREQLAFGDVQENNLYTYASAELDFGNFVLTTGLRLDRFDFQYVDKLLPIYKTQSNDAYILSPKLNVSFNTSNDLKFFIKSGKGFHANDSRVSVQNRLQTLPAAYGIDIGTEWKPLSNIWLSTALWYLYLEQEFVYVGDAAIVEPSGETRRKGIEVGAKIQLGRNLFFDSDGTYTIARSIADPEGNNFIPLAPNLTIAGGLNYKSKVFDAAVRYRYINDRPANEDNSIVADGFLVLDANFNYKLSNFIFGIAIENVLNTEWNQAQFATESQLQNELTPTEEIHFTPGVPFNLKGKISYSF